MPQFPAVSRRDHVAAAERFLAAGQLDEAGALLEAALKVNPNDADMLNAFGGLWLARRDTERATAVLGSAATAFPDHYGLVNNLGIAHQMSGRYEEAGICFRRAAALAPDLDAPLQSLALVRFLAGDLAGARETAARILARRPEAPDAHGLLGLIALGRDELPAAEVHFHHLLSARPEDAVGLRGLSTCCLRRGDVAQALTLAERARLAAPLDIDTLEQLARCQAETGQYAEAIATCRGVLAFAPNHLGLRALMAQIQVAGGQYEAGIADLTKLARANPKSAEALVALAATARQGGQLTHVMPLLDQALKLEPGHARALQLRGEVALALGNFPSKLEQGVPADARIVVPHDMSAGEFILFARFLTGVPTTGETVKLSAEEQFLPIAAHLPVAVEVAPLQPGEIALPLPALLHCFDLEPDWLAGSRPYLQADSALQARWLDALAEHPRPWIGVVWDGGAPGIAMEQLRAALPAAGSFVSLMTGEGRHALARWSAAIDAGVHFASFADMIAAIANLDFVVGPDVAAMHLAGALGCDGAVAVPAYQPWCWASRGGRSLWYPRLTVARQARTGDWSDVVSELGERMVNLKRRG